MQNLKLEIFEKQKLIYQLWRMINEFIGYNHWIVLMEIINVNIGITITLIHY